MADDDTPPDGTDPDRDRARGVRPSPPPLPKRGRAEVVLAAIAGAIGIGVMVLVAFDVDVCGMTRAAGVQLDACKGRMVITASPAPGSASSPDAAAHDGGAP
jgi:hypothetical protein